MGESGAVLCYFNLHVHSTVVWETKQNLVGEARCALNLEKASGEREREEKVFFRPDEISPLLPLPQILNLIYVVPVAPPSLSLSLPPSTYDTPSSPETSLIST